MGCELAFSVFKQAFYRCRSAGTISLRVRNILRTRQFNTQLNSIQPQRSFITYPKETGISGFERNIRARDIETGGKRLPSYIENCRVVSQNEIDSLYKAFPLIVDDIFKVKCTKKLSVANRRLQDYMEHVVPWVPITAVHLVATDSFYLKRQRKKNIVIKNLEEHRQLVYKLAWIMETISRICFALDDMMDKSDKRNGLPNWHTLPGVGELAHSDGCAMLNLGCILLSKYFSDKPYYSELMTVANEALYITNMAEIQLQCLTNLFRKGNERSQWSVIPSESELATAKITLNSTLLLNFGIISAMTMHGFAEPELKNLILEAGNAVVNYALLVDDYLEVYADSQVVERNCTDIQEGKLTWVLWKALELGNPEQRRRLQESYGKSDANHIAEVKQIYRELNVQEALQEMMAAAYLKVENQIAQLPQEDVPCHIQLNMLNHYRDASLGIVSRP